MTKKKANELAIKKWQWIVDNWDYNLTVEVNVIKMLEMYPELIGLEAYCSYCAMYCIGIQICGDCPLIIDGWTCYNRKHPYFSWYKFVKEFNNGTKYAKRILNLIKKVSKKHTD